MPLMFILEVTVEPPLIKGGKDPQMGQTFLQKTNQQYTKVDAIIRGEMAGVTMVMCEILCDLIIMNHIIMCVLFSDQIFHPLM